MKVIDAHAHLSHHPVGLDKLVSSGIYEQIWLMDLSPIGHLLGCDIATREELLAVSRDYPGFFKLFGFLDLDRMAPDDLNCLRDLGFCGLKPYKPLKPYGAFDYYPLYLRAQELKMPILFHTGLIAKGEPYHGGKITQSFGPENARPSHLAGLAEAFPELCIINAHVGWPYLEETEQNLYYYKNIYSDISGYRRTMERITSIFDRRCADDTGRLFIEKMHFASDAFLGMAKENDYALDVLNFWKMYFRLIGKVYYNWGQDKYRDAFFYANAKKLEKQFLAKA